MSLVTQADFNRIAQKVTDQFAWSSPSRSTPRIASRFASRFASTYKGLALACCATWLGLGTDSYAQTTIAKPARYAIQRIAAEPYDQAHQRCASIIGGASAQGVLVNDVEPVLAQHPTQPLQLALVWRTAYSVQFSVSVDGGFNWRKPVTLKLNGCAGGPSVDNELRDARIAVGADGVITVAALLRAPERQVERIDDEGETIVESEPESTAVVVTRSTDFGLRFSNAVVLDNLTANAGLDVNHLALAAHPKRPGLAYLLLTRANAATDGFGVSAARAPLFASASGTRFETLRELTELRARDQFQWGMPQLLIDADREQMVVIAALRDLNDRLANPLSTPRPDFLQMSSASIASLTATIRFGAPRTISTLLPLRRGVQTSVGSAQIPVNPGVDAISVAIDRTRGRYFVSYADARLADGMNLTTSLVASADGGLTWRAPELIEGRKGQAFWRPSVVVDSDGALAITVMRGRGSSTQPSAGFRVESYLTRYSVLDDLSIERDSSELFDQYTYKAGEDNGFTTAIAWPLVALPGRCLLPIVQRHLDRPTSQASQRASQQVDLAAAVFADSAQSCL
jgi:hypothetical protein